LTIHVADLLSPTTLTALNSDIWPVTYIKEYMTNLDVEIIIIGCGLEGVSLT